MISFVDADTAAIRVSNLSENTQEGDLQELFKPFGHIARIYLAKDKITGQCKVYIPFNLFTWHHFWSKYYVWISNHNYSLFILLGICIYKLSQKRRRSKSHCDTQWLWIWSSYLECRMGEAIRNMNNQSKASWCLRGSNITTILFI